ncbi:MAG: hypothetical protein WC655_07820 [Candidatus Hydrogenedentales bacterium]
MSSNQKTRLIIASRDLRRVAVDGYATEEDCRERAAVLACEQRLARRRLQYGMVLSRLLSGNKALG